MFMIELTHGDDGHRPVGFAEDIDQAKALAEKFVNRACCDDMRVVIRRQTLQHCLNCYSLDIHAQILAFLQTQIEDMKSLKATELCDRYVDYIDARFNPPEKYDA